MSAGDTYNYHCTHWSHCTLPAQNMTARLKKLEQDLNSTTKSLNRAISVLNHLIEQQSNTSTSVHRPCSSNCNRPNPIPSSCEDIKKYWPASPSGVYNIAPGPSAEIKSVYCHMESLCGISGPWTKVAYLNMSNSYENCPSILKKYSESNVRGCGRKTNSNPSLYFSSQGLLYSKVCGRVHGYRYHTTDYFTGTTDINGAYIDGISLTYGNPRQHVWSFIPKDYNSNSPCTCSAPITKPAFIGSNFYCQSVTFSNSISPTLLWAGTNCKSHETKCCTKSLLPWFLGNLDAPTISSLELRILCDQDTSDEDVVIGYYDIYIK